MKTLKSHTEQVIQKFDEQWYADSDPSKDHEKWYVQALNDDDPSSKIKAFITTALKELSDLQAEETRVEKVATNHKEVPDTLIMSDCRGVGCHRGGHNSAVEKQEKLSNAFRNL